MRSITSNKEMIAVLTGQFGDYGLPPSESSFMMHAVLAKHYMKGGSYPIGGSAKIFDTIAPAVGNAGGEIFVNAGVKEIIIQDGTATGVELENGDDVSCQKLL